MKLNILDAHDRLKHFAHQSDSISQCCQNLIDQRPFGEHPFYIFAHSRTLGMDEKLKLFSSGVYVSFNEVPEKTIVWQPRLTKPAAQSNSMLFKAYPGKDTIRIIWMIPDRALWHQYNRGNLTESQIVFESIDAFRNNKEKLEMKEDDDLSDERINAIYREISANAKKPKLAI
jgi:hypothetical protein